jgi:hypothetical protein
MSTIQPSVFTGWRKSIASLGFAIARMAGYEAARPSITHKQANRHNTNPNSSTSQLERLMLTWNAEDALKNIPLAGAYIQTRRMYCSPQAWLPSTGDSALNKDVKQYCEEEWKTMGVNCSMWTAFSRTFDVEMPCRGDAGMYWYRDMNGKLKLIEFSADQLGEIYTFVNPASDVTGLNYFSGIYSDPNLGGENVGYRVYDRGYGMNYFNPQRIPASDVLYGQDNLLRGARGVTVFAQSLLTMGKTEQLWQTVLDSSVKQSKTAVVVRNEMGSPYNELSYDTRVENDGSVIYIERNREGAQTEYQYNGDGYEVMKTEQPSPAVIEGLKWGAEMACLAMGMPYSFIVNPAQVGGAPVRLDVGKADKQITRITRLHENVFEKIAYVTIMNGVNNGVFRGAALSKRLTSGKVQFPIGPTVDAFRDDKSSVLFKRAGLTSAQRIMGQTRDDPQEVVEENADWAVMVAKATQDANRKLIKDGYDPTVTPMSIAQDSDNPVQQPSPAEEKPTPQKKASMSAYIADMNISDLPQSAQDAIASVLGTNGSTGAFRVIKYGMVASELEKMADAHNLESAGRNLRYCTNTSCADEVHANQEKHVLINNGRVVDGHHFLAKALKGKVTKSLPVIDLTPTRFQTAEMAFDPNER